MIHLAPTLESLDAALHDAEMQRGKIVLAKGSVTDVERNVALRMGAAAVVDLDGDAERVVGVLRGLEENA